MCDAAQGLGLKIRAGLHTGECELRNGDVAGIAVNIGARVGALAGPGEVLVSSTVKDLVAGSMIAFDDRGAHDLKGVPGEWRLFARGPCVTKPPGAGRGRQMGTEKAQPKGQLKPQVYKDPRPAEHFDRFHARTRAKRPNWMYEAVRLVLTPYLLLFFRTRAIDSDKVPADGPAIVAPNHFSFLDHFFVAVYLRRKVQFMAKSQLFKNPLQIVYHNGGVFPVRRGHRDDEAFATAHAVLARGGIVVMYCEGGRSRTRRARRGQARASAAWRWSPARRSCPSGWWARSACATGSGSSFRRSPCSSATRSASSAWSTPPESSRRRRRRRSSCASRGCGRVCATTGAAPP